MSQGTLFATFYSFKGGVGRTLALVNTAVSLTQQGHSVVIWDMDIEAPGVQNIPYFYESLKGKIKGGFVDIVSDFKKSNYDHLDSDSFSKYVITHPENPKLRLLLTGNLEKEEEYSKKFSAIEWERLFGKNSDAGYRLFENIREELLKYHPDFVLIDSRTGFTDIGGVCGIQLPDINFLVFTYGNQNLRGIRTVYNSVSNEDAIKRLRPDRPLKNYLIASMVPTERPELRKKRREEWERYIRRPHVEIPYNPEMVFNETVWTAEYPDDAACEPYKQIANILVEERSNLSSWGKLLFTINIVAPSPVIEGRGSDQYTPEQLFEMKVADLFRLMEYGVEVQKKIEKNTIDLFLTERTQLDTRYYIVECQGSEKRVDKDAVSLVGMRTISIMQIYPSCRAIIVSRNGFTEEAMKLAATMGIALKTYDELLNGIINFDRYISYIKTLFAGTELEKNYIGQDVLVENAEAVQALSEYVDEWLAAPQGGFFTLLGDYGTGKTSFTKKLSHDLAMRYEKDRSTARVPVLINLKDVSKALSLENIIFDHFQKTAQLNVLPETVLYLLREGNLLLIFDGFDEMSTQSNAALTMKNFMELNRVFAGSAKVILTCRTHYFKDRAETEETVKAKKKGLSEAATELYRAIQGKQGYTLGYLQEFKSNQIEEYLRKTLPDAWQEAMSTIDTVYNLKDLSSRPVLLDMIVKSLPKIREKGGSILAADLYAAYVHSWIDREDWRHELTREGREFLVEELAEKLWDMDTDRVHHSLISSVLKDYLQDKKSIVSVNEIELASSEVRTASFLTRDDDGNYGFAHRSFMEFFLAQRLAKRLREGDIKCLNIKRLSKEVILFLSQLADDSLLITTARGILSKPYQKMISENALFIYYWTIRYQCMGSLKMLPVQTIAEYFRQNKLDKIFLDAADLERADLSGICLTGAHVNGARLNSAILTGASLDHASLTDAELSFASLDSADLRSAKMTMVKADHASFNFSKVCNVDFTGADLHAANFIAADMAGAILASADLSFSGFLKAMNLEIPVGRRETEGSNINLFGLGLPDTHFPSLMISVQLGHSRAVTCVAFSPDGKTIASASEDMTVKIWEAASGRLIRTLRDHAAPVHSIAFSPDGNTLASGDSDGALMLCDMETGVEMSTFRNLSLTNRSVVFSSDGKKLASTGWHEIAILDVEGGGLIKTLNGHTSSVYSVAFSPDGKSLASASWDHTVKLWNVERGEELRTFQGHSSFVYAVAFSPDGHTLASGSSSNGVKIWDAESGEELRTLWGHSGNVTSVAFSPNGKVLASSSYDKMVKIWDTQTGKEINSFQGHSDYVTSVAFSPDGKTLASCGEDMTSRLWEVEGGRGIRALRGHSDYIRTVAFSPDGKTFVSGGEDMTARLWEVESGRGIRALRGHSDYIRTVAFSPDGKTFVSGGEDMTVRLWEVESGREIMAFQGHLNPVNSVAFSPDGKTLASGSWDSSVKLWEIESGREIRTFRGHSNPVNSVAFSPDGKTLASGRGDNSVMLWEVESGGEIMAFQGHSNSVSSVVFSPDGKTLASGSWDNTVKLWEVESGTEIRTFRGHVNHVTCVVFSSDGKTLASGSWDNTVRVWDITTGKEIIKITGRGRVNSVTFWCDCNVLAVGNRDGVSLISIKGKQKEPPDTHALAFFYQLPDNEWAAIARDNRFVCSEGGRAYIYFNDRLALYPASDLPELEHPEGLGLIRTNQAPFSSKK